MHERSLVRSLLNQISKIADENGGGPIGDVHVSIGAISGVESQLIREAFEELKLGTVCADADLKVIEVAMTVRCDDCERETQLGRFVFRCDHCGSGNVRLIRGDEFKLLTVTLK